MTNFLEVEKENIVRNSIRNDARSVKEKCWYSGRRLYQCNEDDFWFQFLFMYIKLLNSINSTNTHKHYRSQDIKCQLKKPSLLYTCKLKVLGKKLLTIKTYIKSRHYCIDIITYFFLNWQNLIKDFSQS